MMKIVNKIVALLCVIIIILSITACGKDSQNDISNNESMPTESINKDDSTNTTDNNEITEPTAPEKTEFNFNYFKVTGESYTKDDKIGQFPLISGNEDFWKLLRFDVFYANKEDEPKEKPAAWDELKNEPLSQFKIVGIGNNNYMSTMAFAFTENAKFMTVGEAILGGHWTAFVTSIKSESIVKTLFPAQANSVAEMFVINYGQPTATSINEKSNAFQIHYHINDIDLMFEIKPADNQYEGEMDYTIGIQFNQIEE